MRVLSLVIIVLLMQWSWALLHREPEISQSVHLGIQKDLKRYISDYISTNRPSAHHLKFEKFWTEKLKKNQVKASFLYSFKDGRENMRVQIEGYAIGKETASEEVWTFDELTILNNRLDFQKATNIRSTPTNNEKDMNHDNE